jgi:flagellar basal-body rod protein FlgG
VRPIAVQKLFTQGEYSQTGNQLDLAIEGKGFFKILRGTEELYTRCGAFKLDKDGYVVDSEGNRLQPEFTVPKNAVSVTVDSGGKMTALGPDGTELSSVQLQLYTFVNPAGLYARGKNYFMPTPASGDAESGNPGDDGRGTVAQGFLEMSNVNVVDEMVAMIIAQRAYEANSKTIQTSDQLLQMANNVKR